MPRPEDRLKENAPGDYFVDASCIDCDTCRQIAPLTYARYDEVGQSVVARQPATDEERLRAAMALVACPTASIGSADKSDVSRAVASFPELIAPDVYYCGYAAESSFGASSYLYRRPEGNVLIDSPRAAKPLLDRIAALGGVRLMILTHRDDVADHELIHRVFGCDRVIHEHDVEGGTTAAEIKVSGEAPLRLAPDLLVIPLPGHTRGSVALLGADRFLWSGDHVWYEPLISKLDASPAVCWHSWPEQIRSMERLADFDFEWIFPGHGRRYHAPSAEVMRHEIKALAARMAKRQR